MDGSASPVKRISASDYLLIANSYKEVGLELAKTNRSPKSDLAYPTRFMILHAVELYLIAWLTHNSAPADKEHDFETKVDAAKDKGICFKTKTYNHIKTLRKEYKFLRYGIAEDASMPPLSRLEATLLEVSKKITKALCPLTK